jgi:hypothetical protein
VNEPETSRDDLFEWWLGIAAAQLIEPAKERIRLEIEAHFAESRESHQAAGCSEAEARVDAVAELGDPDAAAKRFRKRHLTEKEAMYLEGMVAVNKRTTLLFFSYAFYGFMYAYGIHFLHGLKQNHDSFVFPTVAVFMCLCLQTIGFFAARRKSFKPDIRLLLILEILHSGCFAVALGMMVGTGMGVGPGWAFCFAVLFGQTRSLVRDFHLWLKLGQVDELWEAT